MAEVKEKVIHCYASWYVYQLCDQVVIIKRAKPGSFFVGGCGSVERRFVASRVVVTRQPALIPTADDLFHLHLKE